MSLFIKCKGPICFPKHQKLKIAKGTNLMQTKWWNPSDLFYSPDV